ncbi:peroxidase 27 [Rosa sericea]
MKANNINLILLVCIVVCINLGGCVGGSLRKRFYKQTCPLAEQIVKNATWNHVSANPNLPAKLLRMHFHDCFVRGCEASVLLSSTANNTAEKDSFPNSSLEGFDVIDDIKEQLEKECPGVVSCADILALATRDSMSFQFKKSLWDVLTGRRDGTVSIANEVLRNLPPPFFNFTQLKQSFANRGLTVQDLVVLSGAHSIGVGHCNLFSNRLYNFTGKGDQDPSLDSTYAALLKTQCQGPRDTTTAVEIDPGSFQKFDNHYYTNLKQNKGLFQSDAALLTNKVSSNAVQKLLKANDFFTEFGQSMKRMGAIGVLTGTSGQIRKQCGVVNSN